MMANTNDEHGYDIEAFRSWNAEKSVKRYFPIMAKHPVDPIWVRQAPNKVCVIGTTQPIDPLQIRLHTELIGGKVTHDTIIADSEQQPDWVIRAHMRGVLLELNTSILTEPHFLRDHHMENGFIALIKAHIDDSEKQLERFTVHPHDPLC